MVAPTDSDKRAYFLSLEGSRDGHSIPLAELLERLRFNERGLAPVITQDAMNGEVLMLAWVNEEALTQTLRSGQMTYFSRSRNKLWVKGETSGHTQKVVDVRIDCDGDALLCRVIQEGAACHTERRSCFYVQTQPEADSAQINSSLSLDALASKEP
ncbi:phosphoribosyl-AMP cyclohydrolase [Halioglobus japonicus]|uniref:Phosphoribosyl-AMP cyclohydrolase n=1 Tax=Halioglobus japonicus TaxID=930805 RepID=A0AAP8MF25_9GAMM|nr:phosphoribosyl-AMP cyclohydrolase [Halioglobus japonicus]AQA18599.1 phosphoribosyl-AMP cyclohydrolase [Halioglobus japonicus]PLW86623.1 phosphoribosyl-AMP cyclohydrolase [Halioglobus japonicus]GHD11911.1 hypothetical protein GCM10007052_12170 [Halioglobus japonicus]